MAGWVRGVAVVLAVVAAVVGGASGAQGQDGGGETLVMSPSGGLLPGEVVTIAGGGFGAGEYRFVYCTPDFVLGDLESQYEHCTGWYGNDPIVPASDGTFSTSGWGPIRQVDARSGSVVCGSGADACSIGINRWTGDLDPWAEPVLAAARYELVPETFTASPAGGLLEGQELTVEATGLSPNHAGLVMFCPRSASDHWLDLLTLCDTFHDVGELVSLNAGPDGRGSVDLTARVRIGNGTAGQRTVCTDQCEVRLQTTTARTLRAPIEFAEAEVTAMPDSGLADGQAVRVDATDMVPTYQGAPVWIFPSGGWALVQCAGGLADGDPGPTLQQMFGACAAEPTSRPVDVPGHEAHETIEVRRSFTSFLGDTVDCAGPAGTCTVGLVRLEENGQVTTHLVPVGFG